MLTPQIEQRLQEFLKKVKEFGDEPARLLVYSTSFKKIVREILQEALEEQHKQFLESAKSNAEWTTKYIERKLKAQREALGAEEKKCSKCGGLKKVGAVGIEWTCLNCKETE